MDHAERTRELVAKLGGRQPIAKALGISPEAVSQWQGEGIPHRHFLRLMEMADLAGYSVTWQMLEACRPSKAA